MAPFFSRTCISSSLDPILKLANRYPGTAWESFKNVTTHQWHFSTKCSRVQLPVSTNRHSHDTPSTSKNPEILSSRRSSYLGIHNFFVNTSAHYHEPCSISPLSHRVHFSTISQNNFRPSRTISGTGSLHFAAYEEGQLQGTAGLSAPDATVARYDWRMRASSRIRRGKTLAGEDHDRYTSYSQVVKRIPPPQIGAQKGEPFYEEINAYSKRYVSS